MPKSELVGIVACSGEELPEGTVSRIAVWKVFGSLKSSSVVTTCLPLFIAGHKQEREFVLTHPTVTIEGCEKRCAEKALRIVGGKPSATILVTDVEKETSLIPRSRVHLGEDGEKLADRVAEKVENEVKKLLSKGGGDDE